MKRMRSKHKIDFNLFLCCVLDKNLHWNPSLKIRRVGTGVKIRSQDTHVCHFRVEFTVHPWIMSH